MTLHLIFGEAALELVPRTISNHPSILAHARRKGKKPSEILLDVSYHYAAMKALEHLGKRGRPDITHFSVLEALSSPLNKEGQLETWIHTLQDFVIQVEPGTRIPRNYERFVGLIEQLFKERKVPSRGKPLLQMNPSTIEALIERIQPTKLVALSTLGRPSTLERICRSLAETPRPAVIVGCFARGHFSNRTAKLAHEVFSVDREPLDSWVVTSRVIYEYERTVSLPQRRLPSPDSR